jgi:hypothetical protein
MASLHRSLAFMAMLSLLSVCLAIDMSIIDYNIKHGQVPERTEAETRRIYEMWLVKHGRAYNALGEKERRFEIFKDNLKFIDEHNSVGNPSYKLGLNKFADLSNEEYRSVYLGTRMDGKRRLLGGPKSERYLFKEGDDLPETVDWREKGAVAPVKDQGQCGMFLFLFSFFFLFLSTGCRWTANLLGLRLMKDNFIPDFPSFCVCVCVCVCVLFWGFRFDNRRGTTGIFFSKDVLSLGLLCLTMKLSLSFAIVNLLYVCLFFLRLDIWWEQLLLFIRI